MVHDILTGRHEVEAAIMEIATSALAKGSKVFWVDGSNSFNPYMLTEAAKRLNINPQPLLRRLFVARAFTVHQLVAMIIRHLGPALDKHPDALGVIFNPMALCCNPDVSKTEADRALQKIVLEIKRIRKKGHRLIVAIPAANHSVMVSLSNHSMTLGDFRVNCHETGVSQRAIKINPLNPPLNKGGDMPTK